MVILFTLILILVEVVQIHRYNVVHMCTLSIVLITTHTHTHTHAHTHLQHSHPLTTIHTRTYYFRMKLKRNRRLLVILTLLAGLLLTYEVYLTLKVNPLASQEQKVYYTRDLSSVQNPRNLRKLLEDREIQELPVQISADCSTEQIHQSLMGSDILCINESQLWSDVTQRGVKINQLSDLQAKTAIVSAVLKEMESRKARVREQVSRQFVERMNLNGHNKAMHSTYTDAQFDSVRIKSREVVKVKGIPSFHESMVASFVKESKNRPSDIAIPRLDSYYESHLPCEKSSQEDGDGEDFDGVLFPSDMKPRKPVKRPFMPLVMNSSQLNDFNGDWGNPFNNKWKHSVIPGIPPMPGQPPDVPHVESGDNLLQRPPDGPKIQAISPSVPSIQSGIPKFPLKYPYTIPKMPDRPPSLPITPPKYKLARRSSAVSLSEDLLQLKGYKFRENFDLIMRKLPTRFKYDGIRIKERLKYIERAVNATDVVFRDVAAVSLNPDILERAKV